MSPPPEEGFEASLAPRGGVRRAVLPCTLRRKGILLPALLATLFTAATNTCFATAYMTTAAANAVVLIEINPLWGAALGWLFLSDVLPVRTAVAIAVDRDGVEHAVLFGLVAGIAGNGEAGDDDAGERQPACDDDGLVQCFHFICWYCDSVR